MNQQRVASHKRDHGQGLTTRHELLHPQHSPKPSTGPGKGSITLGVPEGSPGKKTRESGCASTARTGARIEDKLTGPVAFEFFFFFFLFFFFFKEIFCCDKNIYHEIYPFIFLSVQSNIVNYKHDAVQQISRTYSSCIAETLY